MPCVIFIGDEHGRNMIVGERVGEIVDGLSLGNSSPLLWQLKHHEVQRRGLTASPLVPSPYDIQPALLQFSVNHLAARQRFRSH